jgi:hypothetical protein
MSSGYSNSAPHPTTIRRGGRILKAGFWALLGISATGVLFYKSCQRLAVIPVDQFSRSSKVERAGNFSSDKFKSKEKPATEAQPHLELQKIIPFGRSLEIIGRVEAGSRLAVNNETVEVSGDGSFKHFTKPFTSGNRIRLEIKATDLAGRTRILTAFHDFGSSGENN